MYGGETHIIPININSTFEAPVFVYLYKNVTNNSQNLNGFYLSSSDNNFVIQPNENKIINITIRTDLNIMPEIYTIKMYGSSNIEVAYFGGGGIIYRDIYRDRNIYIDSNFDRNIYIPVNYYIDRNIVEFLDRNIYIDKNINIDKPYIPNEWLIGLLIGGLIIGGGIIFIYFRLNKSKSI